MFKFDKEKKLLDIKKIENPKVDLDLLQDQKDSYNKYINETYLEDVNYFFSYLQEKVKSEISDIKIVRKELLSTQYKRDIKKLGNKYYPVEVSYNIGYSQVGPVTLLRIPYLDDFCKLNIDGRRKIVVNEQRPSDDISFDQKKGTLNIKVPRASITIYCNNKGIKIKYDDKRVDLDLVIRAFLLKEEMVIRDYDLNPVSLPKFLANSYLVRNINTNEFLDEEQNLGVIEKTGILRKFDSLQYKLGETREALNNFLNIDRSLGETLSRPVLGYEESTVITPLMISQFKKQRINHLYVKDLPDLDGLWLSTKKPVFYTTIPMGMQNCGYLREAFPEFSEEAYIPETIELDPMNPLIIPTNVPLTKEAVEFMYLMGEKEIVCSRSKTRTVCETYRFEREIVGNYTARLRELLDVIPNGRSADEWVYYYNNPTLTQLDNDKLNPFDLIAIMSLLGSIKTTGINMLLNKDENYLKKVNMVNETFSEHFRRTVPAFIRKYRDALSDPRKTSNLNSVYPRLTGLWIRSMQDAKLLAEADTVNIASEITQVSHISTVLKNSNSVDEAMRHLALPIFGRLCPYETPAGKKLGLVNTKAIGARVKDGKLVAPYRRVKKNSNGISISNKIEYLNVKDEMNYKLGDILDLEKDYKGDYINNKVKARIPNPERTGDSIIVSTINAFELDYVTAHTEQSLSPTATLVPCLASNDSNRVTFGLNMIRQTIYVQYSQIPSVSTFMYEDIFAYSNSFLIRARKSGTVMDIGANSLSIMYDDGELEELDVPETRITNQSIIFLNYLVKVGDRFNQDDILVCSSVSKEGVFTPARNALVGYLSSGWNYEDALDISVNMSIDYISIASNTVEQNIPRSAGKSISIGSANKFNYVDENSIITKLTTLDNNDPDRKRSSKIKSGDNSGIFYSTERSTDESGNINYKCHLLGFNKLKAGDKMAGRHGNKGVVSHETPNSQMPILANGRVLDALLNPCGIPSRMNLGQIEEAHLGLVCLVLGIRSNSDPFNGATIDDLKMLMSYAYDLANADSYAEAERKTRYYPMLPKELHEHCLDNFLEIQDWKGVFNKKGEARLWDPQTETYFENPICIGYVYFLKLVHEVDHKLHARAGMLEETYSAIDKQPTKGASKGGGQRFGEMELVALAAYGATAVLREVMNETSDNVGARTNIHLEALNYKERVPEEYCISRSVENLVYSLEAMGVHTQIDTDEIPSLSDAAGARKFTYDVRSLIRNKIANNSTDSGVKSAEEVAFELDNM